jgi:hypothetical protein
MTFDELEGYRRSLDISQEHLGNILGVEYDRYTVLSHWGTMPSFIDRHIETLNLLNPDVLVSLINKYKVEA